MKNEKAADGRIIRVNRHGQLHGNTKCDDCGRAQRDLLRRWLDAVMYCAPGSYAGRKGGAFLCGSCQIDAAEILDIEARVNKYWALRNTQLSARQRLRWAISALRRVRHDAAARMARLAR